MEDMSKTNFSISYDGQALKDGSMDVRDLAPALFAIGQLFDAAYKEINGEKSEAKVHIVATQKGSFEISLDLFQGSIGPAIDFFSGDKINAALNLKNIILGSSGVGYGLFKFIKWVRGRTPPKVQNIENEITRIEIEGDVTEIANKVWELYQNPVIRQAIEKIVSPLKKEGVQSVVMADEKIKERIEKEEYRSFEYRDLDEETLHDNTIEKTFSINALSFNPDNKWRLYDGEQTYSLVINDREFLDKVEKGKCFTINDILVCQFRMKQTMVGSKLKSVYSVEKVISHRQTQKPTPLIPD